MLVSALLAAAGGFAVAQGHPATPGLDSRVTVGADVGAIVRPILALRKVGAPVLLDDGRYEQRYQVTANVLFRLSSAAHSDDVRCAAESRELSLAEYAGLAGFQTDVRVRSADPAALDVSAERFTSAATVQPSGR